MNLSVLISVQFKNRVYLSEQQTPRMYSPPPCGNQSVTVGGWWSYRPVMHGRASLLLLLVPKCTYL